MQAEFEKNLAFALDLAKSAARPDEPKSHLGNTAPDFVPTTFPISNGDPQTVEVNAKRSLGDVKVYWQVNDGRVQRGDHGEWGGGERYGQPGVYYHKLRGQVSGAKPGDKVKVWFGRGNKASDPFTYTVKSDTGNPVLLMVAEDYTGNSADLERHALPGPLYQGDYGRADDRRHRSDVYDVDANGRTAASALGVLSHYKAVIWETGEDLYVREPGQPGGTGTAKLFDDEILDVRDYMNEGGKVLVAGKLALQGGWDQFLFNPLGAPPRPFCSQPDRLQRRRRPAGPAQLRGDLGRLPAVLAGGLPAGDGGDRHRRCGGAAVESGAPFGSAAFTLNGADSSRTRTTCTRS